MNLMRRFRKCEEGYVLVLTVIALPALLLIALLVIDVSRGNNAQSDLQAAADSLALAGAKELNGEADAIDRAREAMAELTNSVSLLAPAGEDVNIDLVYPYNASTKTVGADNPFTVIFLDEIPESDADPIDQAWVNAHAVADSAQEDAVYVYVRAQSRNLQAIFAAVRETITGDVPVAATAVARLGPPIACNITPIFICNPLEDTSKTPEQNGIDFRAAFGDGDFYGRLFELRFDSSTSAGPGNFGFLRVAGGSGANVLREALAKGDTGLCFEQDGVDTEPGATVGPVETAIGTHFGIYSGNLNNSTYKDNPLFRPAPNVRMGQSGNSCNDYDAEEDPLQGLALPTPDTMPELVGGGGFWSASNSWGTYYYDHDTNEDTDALELDLFDLYWHVNHGANTSLFNNGNAWSGSGPVYTTESDLPDARSLVVPNTGGVTLKDDILAVNTYPGTTLPSNADFTPSRYDTYMYELRKDPDGTGMIGDTAPNGETGIVPAQCWSGDQFADYSDYRPRRIIVAAVINCLAEMGGGAQTGLPTIGLARMFLTKPVLRDGNERRISLEIVDISGPEGLGGVEEIRRDVLLVR